MSKKTVAWLVLVCMLAGTVAHAVPAYASEPQETVDFSTGGGEEITLENEEDTLEDTLDETEQSPEVILTLHEVKSLCSTEMEEADLNDLFAPELSIDEQIYMLDQAAYEDAGIEMADDTFGISYYFLDRESELGQKISAWMDAQDNSEAPELIEEIREDGGLVLSEIENEEEQEILVAAVAETDDGIRALQGMVVMLEAESQEEEAEDPDAEDTPDAEKIEDIEEPDELEGNIDDASAVAEKEEPDELEGNVEDAGAVTDKEDPDEVIGEEESGDELMGFSDGYKDEMGYFGGYISFEPKSENYGKTVTVYARKDTKDFYLGTTKLTDPKDATGGTDDEKESNYLKSVGVNLLKSQELGAGEYEIHATITDPDTGETKAYGGKNLKLNVFPAPKLTDDETSQVIVTEDSITVKKGGESEAAVDAWLYKYGKNVDEYEQVAFTGDTAVFTTYLTYDLSAYSDERFFVCYGSGSYTHALGEKMQKDGVVNFHSPYVEVSLKRSEIKGTKIDLCPHLGITPLGTFKEIFIGEPFQIDAIVKNATDKRADDQNVTFTSGDPKIFTVDAVGNVTAKKVGQADLTVMSETYKLKAQVRLVVSEKEKIKKMTVTPAKVKGKPGDEVDLTLTMDAGLEGTVDWSVDADSGVNFSYSTTPVTDGKSKVNMKLGKGGVYTVTARANVHTADPKYYENKKVSVTVTVDGAADKSAYKNGKQLIGWVAFNAEDAIVATGNAALKLAPEARTEGYTIRYYTADTMQPATGLWTINKKYYYFYNDGELGIGTSESDIHTLSSQALAVSNTGEVLTGRVRDYYYDPQLKIDTWVYDKSKKGYVFVRREDGCVLSQDGIYRLSDGDSDVYKDAVYVFKDGVRQTGFVYLDDTGKVTTKNNAAKMVYADPLYGVVKSSEFFTVGDKTYHAGVSASDTYTIATGRFTVGANNYYADANGVVQYDKAIPVSGGAIYVSKDGTINESGFRVINGKMCRLFEGEVILIDAPGTTADDLYLDAEGTKSVYCKSATTKPEGGVFFYYDDECKKKVTKSWLYYGGKETFYLDSSGKAVTGIAKVNGWSYYFTETGKLSAEKETLVTWKGKDYWLGNTPGVIATSAVVSTGTFFIDTADSINRDGIHVWVKKDGQPDSGIKTVSGTKYLVLEDGIECTDDLTEYKGKYYHIHATKKSNGYKSGTGTIKQSDQDYCELIGPYAELFWFNKDGTVKTGWITTKDKKKYYQPARVQDKYGFIYGCCRDNEDGSLEYLYRIGGKLYHFDKDGAMDTGWLHINGPVIEEYETDAWKGYYGYYNFYFDEKSGAAVTGWQTKNAPAVGVDGWVVTNGNRPVLTDVKKKLYFLEEDTGEAPACALAGYDDYGTADLSIKGKRYRFAPDGSLLTGRAGLVDEDPGENGDDMFLNADGSFATGRIKVGKDWYYYNLKTGLKEKNVLRLTKGKWYYYGDDGKMSTACAGYFNVKYNADGSIAYFSDIYGCMLKNTKIKVGEQYYYLGLKGLPLTGLQRCIFKISGKYICYIYSESDGSVNTDKEYTFVKSGKKIYAVQGDIVENNGIIGYLFESGYGCRVDYSSLSKADRERLDRLVMWAANNHKDIYFYTRMDGSLYMNEVVDTGYGRFTVNAVGIFVYNYSVFAKRGNSWYGYYASPGTDTEGVTSLSTGESLYIELRYDQEGRLISAVDEETQTPLNGAYKFGLTNTYCFKNGQLVGGQQSVNYFGFNLSLYFDPDGGTCLDPVNL